MTTTRYANLLSGAIGGLVVLLIGAVLVAAGVVDLTDEKTVVRQTPAAQPAADAGTEGKTVRDIYREEGRGVVFVEARGVQQESSLFGLPQDQEGTATGSGFLVDDEGTIITNAHVVEGSNDVSVSFDEDGGDVVPAEVKGRDPSTDIAVLKVDPGKISAAPPLPLGDSSAAEVGDPVVAIGNPFGFTRTVTTGIVSAVAREIKAPNGFSISNVVQTDASVNPGNSGGPLLDAQGRVIGINSQIATGGGSGSVGIAFAIPINTVKKFLPELREGGEIERAYLGIEMAPVSEALAEDLNLPRDEGALVTCVADGGPAEDAGLRGARTDADSGIRAGGDLLVQVDGKTIAVPEDVSSAIADDKPGETIQVAYYRGDDRRTARIKLASRPSDLSESGCESAAESVP
ncbi:MAG TPA: trypsin-like peptidase domain-containing protein [Thermoleophilaceae bacterium]|nr:trypsin-like peptidase domain-containing protein [Thermoleophilaceae bacterium]